MNTLVIDALDERRGRLEAWLRELGHEVESLAKAPAQLPSADLAVIAGPDLVELAEAYRSTGKVKWILAVVPAASAAAALEAGAHDCVLEPVDAEGLGLRLAVAEASGSLAPGLAGKDQLGAVIPEVNGRQLRALFELLPVPIGITDGSGRLLQCNRELERTFRRKPGTLVGRPLSDFFAADDVRAGLELVQKQGVVHGQEISLAERYQSEFWVAADARWIDLGDEALMVGSFSDITERRVTARALRKSEASLRSVLQASPDGIIVHAKGRYFYLNATALAQLGYDDLEQLRGKEVFSHVDPSEVERVKGRIEAMMDSGEPGPVVDIQFRRRDGEIFVGEVASIPALFDGQEAIISIIRDVGEKRRLQSQLFLADRLATVGTLAIGVAHEINNPLSWVIGNLGLLADELDKQVRMREDPDHDPAAVAESRARIRERLARTQAGAERVRKIVRDLARFGHPEADADERFDIHALLDSTIEIAEVQVRHRARVERDYQAGRLRSDGSRRAKVRGSEARLGQVFLNLLVNAGQAIEPGSPRDNVVRVSTRSLADGRTQVEIADTGCGIPEHVRGRIFEPFFTTKPAGEGTGIGLAISYSIVAKLGGELDVSSVEGEGTSFFVRLPADERADERSRAGRVIRDEDEEQAATRRARVLVVDDEPLIREMVCDALSEHAVQACASGREALEHIDDQAWDLILCDLIMPELSGGELWQEIVERRPKLRDKLVFMTGGDFSGKDPRFPVGEKVRRLEKPFSIKALRKLVAASTS